MKLDRFEKAKTAESERNSEINAAKTTRESALNALQATLENRVHYQFDNSGKFKYGGRADVTTLVGYIKDGISEWECKAAQAVSEYDARINAAKAKFDATMATL